MQYAKNILKVVICFFSLMQLSQTILRDELIIFEKKFKEAVKSQVPLLDRIMRFIVNRKGKQLRPMFVLLCAKLCGEVNESDLSRRFPWWNCSTLPRLFMM